MILRAELGHGDFAVAWFETTLMVASGTVPGSDTALYLTPKDSKFSIRLSKIRIRAEAFRLQVSQCCNACVPPPPGVSISVI